MVPPGSGLTVKQASIPQPVIVHLVGTFVLAGFFGVECRDTDTSSAFFSHFTTWSWTLLLLFLATATPAVADPAYWVVVTAVGFFWTFGVVFVVLILLCVMTYRDEIVILRYSDFSTVYVGAYRGCGVGVRRPNTKTESYKGDKILHTLPCFVMLLFFILFKRYLRSATAFILGTKWRVAAYIWFYVSPLILIIIYGATHDLYVQYRSTMPNWLGALSTIITLGITQSLLLWILVWQYKGAEFRV